MFSNVKFKDTIIHEVKSNNASISFFKNEKKIWFTLTPKIDTEYPIDDCFPILSKSVKILYNAIIEFFYKIEEINNNPNISNGSWIKFPVLDKNLPINITKLVFEIIALFISTKEYNNSFYFEKMSTENMKIFKKIVNEINEKLSNFLEEE